MKKVLGFKGLLGLMCWDVEESAPFYRWGEGGVWIM